MPNHIQDLSVIVLTFLAYLIPEGEKIIFIIPWIFQDIDEYLCQAKDKSYDTLMHFGRKSLNVAATAAVMAASKVTLYTLTY